VLGDNIIEKNIRKAADAFAAQKEGAKILFKEVSDPCRFGVPELRGDRIVGVEEKPKAPKSNYAVIGSISMIGWCLTSSKPLNRQTEANWRSPT